MDYLKDPDLIYAASFATIRAEAELSHIPLDAQDIAVRIIHSCGMVDVVGDLIVTPDFVPSARKALAATKPILTDAEMVRHGIISKTQKIICTLNDERARERGIAQQITRSAAAVELWVEHLDGAFVVIGNAPTALFRLLELLDQGAPRPAAIAAFPVGFVGASESKEALIAHSHGIPYATLCGRKGGSAMAAATVNALTKSTA